MGVFARLAILPLGLSFVLGACSDEEPSPVVDDNIAWQVCRLNANGTCAARYPENRQANDMDTPFQVSCGTSAGRWNFTIIDPGNDVLVPPRPRSVLEVRNINRQTGECVVEVQEPEGTSGVVSKYTGQCPADCTISIQESQGNWDFEASLSCDGLRVPNSAGGDVHALYAPDSYDPVVVKLGNCN